MFGQQNHAYLGGPILHGELRPPAQIAAAASPVFSAASGAAAAGVPAQRGERGEQLEELVAEGVVEPPIKERVVAIGAHGEDVAQEEDEVVVVPAAAVVGQLQGG